MNQANTNDSAFDTLEIRVYRALESYSNVHRGSGHHSIVTTHLYEKSREIVLGHFGLNPKDHTVVFATSRAAAAMMARQNGAKFRLIASADIGLHLGVSALAIEKRLLGKLTPIQTGGGAARLVSPGSVIWARGVEKHEAGTPAIINVIAFASALTILKNDPDVKFTPNNGEPENATKLLFEDDLADFRGESLLTELKKRLVGRRVNVPSMAGDTPSFSSSRA